MDEGLLLHGWVEGLMNIETQRPIRNNILHNSKNKQELNFFIIKLSFIKNKYLVNLINF